MKKDGKFLPSINMAHLESSKRQIYVPVPPLNLSARSPRFRRPATTGNFGFSQTNLHSSRKHGYSPRGKKNKSPRKKRSSTTSAAVEYIQGNLTLRKGNKNQSPRRESMFLVQEENDFSYVGELMTQNRKLQKKVDLLQNECDNWRMTYITVKEEMDTSLRRMELDYENALDTIRKMETKKLNVGKVVDKYEDQLNELGERHDEILSSLKKGLSSKISMLKRDYRKDLEAVDKEIEKSRGVMDEFLYYEEAQMKHTIEQFKSDVKRTKLRHEKEMDRLGEVSSDKSDIHLMHSRFNSELENLRNQAKSKVQKLKSSIQHKLSELEKNQKYLHQEIHETYNKKLLAMDNEYKASLKTQKRIFEQEAVPINQNCQSEINHLRNSILQICDGMVKSFDRKLKQHNVSYDARIKSSNLKVKQMAESELQSQNVIVEEKIQEWKKEQAKHLSFQYDIMSKRFHDISEGILALDANEISTSIDSPKVAIETSATETFDSEEQKQDSLTNLRNSCASIEMEISNLKSKYKAEIKENKVKDANYIIGLSKEYEEKITNLHNINNSLSKRICNVVKETDCNSHDKSLENQILPEFELDISTISDIPAKKNNHILTADYESVIEEFYADPYQKHRKENDE